MERNEILKQLEDQFLNNFANNGYKSEFKPDGYYTECNFGGLLVIVGNSGESVLVWSDWSDNAISEQITECEIEWEIDEDKEEDEDNNLVAGFNYNNSFYRLDEVMRINS